MSDITGASVTPQENLKEKIKEMMPEVFSEGKIDWERLKAALGEDINFSNERYVLNWAGKSDAFRVLQAPTTQTLVPAKDESVNFDDTEHLFIEGENLQVLKVLQKSYFGKVKMIYIDPPYNTGSDSFIYPDRFAESKEDYQKRVGDKDEDGYMTREGLFRTNSKENGQYHSNWLNMMYPRLYLGKNLLQEDGVIIVSIDDHEVHNLRLLMNEIYGEENFIAEMVWQKSKKGDAKLVAKIHEYIIVYAKNVDRLKESGIWRIEKEGADDVLGIYKKLRKKHPGDHSKIEEEIRNWYNSLDKDDPRKKHKHYRFSDERGLYFPDNFAGPNDGRKSRPRYDIVHPNTGKVCKKPSTGWRWDEKRTKKALEDNPPWIHFGEDETTIPCRKSYLHLIDKEPISSVFYKDGRSASKQLAELIGKNIFDFPKDTEVLKKFINVITGYGDIVLDFFGGSGTVGNAVLELNLESSEERSYILVQLPEPTEKDSAAKLSGYENIADIAKERLRRIKKKIREENPEYDGDLGFKVLKIADSNFKQWQEVNIKDTDTLSKQLEIFVNPLSDTADTQHIVYELLLKSGKDLNSKIEERDGYYLINDGELVFMLEEATDAIIKAVIDHKPEKVIALDVIFEKKDQLKTNTVLQMKDAGIEFKTL